MISFIMPAKNASLYIRDAINALQKANYQDWELIVIDDHSSDDTSAILTQAGKEDSRIMVSKNEGCGKVQALNHGYSMVNGEIIKCLDADDVLATTFFDFIEDMNDYDASCHDCYIARSNLKIVGEYSMNKAYFSKSFEYCLKNLISLPRWTWSFKRNIGNIIFPMPEDLPFEDVWFSLIIKKFAKDNIRHIAKPLYYYRQHSKQVFGGILNFNPEIVSFRAQRILKLIDVIKHEQSKRLISGINGTDFFDEIRRFYELSAKETIGLWEIITLDMVPELKAKLLLYKKMRLIVPLIVRLKWFLDKKRKATN